MGLDQHRRNTMSKAVSRGQALQVSARVATQVNWNELDGGCLQDRVISLTPEEFGVRFTAFLKNGANLIIGSPMIIPIDRTKPFNPAQFLREGWRFWRGSAGGNGLEGELEQDKRSLALTQIDTSKILLEAHLKPKETYTTGEERLRRLIAADRIRLDLGVFHAFWNNKTFIPVGFQEKTNNQTTCVFFDGQMLRSPLGERCTLFLCLHVGGEWRWRVYWLGSRRRVNDPSAVLAS